uniref:Non-structural protein 4 n=1 Tax=Rotavirus B TaxID=28876 RepID=A0A2H4ZSJ0_9REOV|nr:non-structural protein 4 [Rotavirus B]AUG44897.1 non-structural protein 4 [Rotavirus B]AUG44898.1 non-structural protein 4 [Rotavirus B]AUG44900.1 non-structural protein 4 [Rotavirus B]AUG44901.1 non-structural protein 4 [Rotavirus B]
MAEDSNMEQVIVNTLYDQILGFAENTTHEQIKETILNSPPQKILTGTFLTLGTLLTTIILKKKGINILTNKLKSNITFLAEMLVRKAERTIDEIIEKTLRRHELMRKMNDIDNVLKDVEKMKYDIEHIGGLDITKELFSMCEQKMIDIDEKIRDIEKSCERRIRDYDWKINALTLHPVQQTAVHNETATKKDEVEIIDETVQNTRAKPIKTRLAPKRL